MRPRHGARAVAARSPALPGAYPGPSTGERPIYAGRFNMEERKAIDEERVDL
jgi:hypothetical protein